MNARVKGVQDIERVTIVKQNEEWVIQTAGSNLSKIIAIDGIDTSRITTNNVYEVWQTLGIEAARNALIKEITNTLEEQGLEVDMRHIMLVADLMTSKGHLQQIGRHGIAGTKTSVLARAAFEITVPTIAKASLEGQVESLKGVTENVIVGATVPIGTGMVELYMSVKDENEKSRKIIKEAISSNKCKIGTRQVMGSIRGSKLIVLSNSMMSRNKSKILEIAKSAQVPTLNYDGNSVQLGRLCNKTFRISALSLKIGKDNEIQELLTDFGNK